MARSSASNSSNEVTFGTVAPTTVDHNDGDTYFVTSNGTSTGTPSEHWTFDGETNEWVQMPGGGTTCPGPMTITQLRSLRNAGNLNKDCHYVVTNYNRGTVGAATIILHAVDETTLGHGVQVKTAFDNVAWDGRFDIDTSRILELSDNLGNKVTGQEIVDTFPWGNTQVYDNIVDEGATLNYTTGAFFDNHIRTGAIVTIDSTTGNFARNVIGEDSNVTWTGGDVRDNIIGTDAVLIKSSSGDFDNNELHSFAQANVSGTANVDQISMGQNSRLTISAGAFSQSHIGSDSQFTSVGGTHYENEIVGSASVTLTTTRNFYQNNVGRNATLVIGDHNVYGSDFQATSVNTTGSAGNGIAYCKFFDSFGNTNIRDIASLTIQYSTIANNSSISANGAARLYMRFCTLENYGRIIQSAGTQLDMNYTGVRDYSYVQALGGRLYVNYSSLSAIGYIQQAATVTGTNRVERCVITSQSNARLLGTSTGCRIYYCHINSGGSIYHNGTSTNCYFYYCDVSSLSTMYSQDSVGLRAYYNTTSGNSQIYSINVTATHYMYYNTMSGHGYLWFRDAAGGRIYAVSCHGQAVARMRGSTAAGRLYYSSFTAYYYLYAENWTITRYSLHGYGRRTYTVTNPPANGTYVQNF